MIIKIRPMISADKQDIMSLLKDIPEFTPSEIDVAEEVIDSYLASPIKSGYRILIAEADSAIVGYICFGLNPMAKSTWDIYWMAVSPKIQRRGIGSALISAAEDEIRSSYGTMAIIETSSKPEYEKTRRFHLTQGYRIIATIPDFYDVGDDKLILQKSLHESSGDDAGES